MEMKAQLADFQLLTATPLTPAIGAEISGVDLSQPVSDALFEEIHRALTEYQVIFFRDQDIVIEQQKSLARRFGPLHSPRAAPAPDGGAGGGVKRTGTPGQAGFRRSTALRHSAGRVWV